MTASALPRHTTPAARLPDAGDGVSESPSRDSRAAAAGHLPLAWWRTLEPLRSAQHTASAAGGVSPEPSGLAAALSRAWAGSWRRRTPPSKYPGHRTAPGVELKAHPAPLLSFQAGHRTGALEPGRHETPAPLSPLAAAAAALDHLLGDPPHLVLLGAHVALGTRDPSQVGAAVRPPGRSRRARARTPWGGSRRAAGGQKGPHAVPELSSPPRLLPWPCLLRLI